MPSEEEFDEVNSNMVEWNKKSRRQVPFVEPVGGNHLEIKTSYILHQTSYILHIDRSMTL